MPAMLQDRSFLVGSSAAARLGEKNWQNSKPKVESTLHLAVPPTDFYKIGDPSSYLDPPNRMAVSCIPVEIYQSPPTQMCVLF